MVRWWCVVQWAEQRRVGGGTHATRPGTLMCGMLSLRSWLLQRLFRPGRVGVLGWPGLRRDAGCSVAVAALAAATLTLRGQPAAQLIPRGRT